MIVANDGTYAVVVGAELLYRLRNRIIYKVASIVDFASEDVSMSWEVAAIVDSWTNSCTGSRPAARNGACT
jgi:hypothetical protein